VIGVEILRVIILGDNIPVGPGEMDIVVLVDPIKTVAPWQLEVEVLVVVGA